jgi:hypothetical protein
VPTDRHNPVDWRCLARRVGECMGLSSYRTSVIPGLSLQSPNMNHMRFSEGSMDEETGLGQDLVHFSTAAYNDSRTISLGFNCFNKGKERAVSACFKRAYQRGGAG